MSEPKSPPVTTAQGSRAGDESSPASATRVKGRAGRRARPAEGLRLVALDPTDLTVMAANLQDAVARVRDMAFVPKEQRFALLLNRFDWSLSPPDERDNSAQAAPTLQRRRCALRFEHVRSAKVSGVVQSDKRRVLSLLTIGFEQAREGDPDGFVTLLFSAGAAIRLEVECVEAELVDLGAGWRTASKPDHPQY